MKKMKQLGGWLLTAVLLITMCAAGASPVSAEIYTGYMGQPFVEWTLDTTTGVLSFRGKGTVATPSGSPVELYFDYRDTIKTVIIGDGITDFTGAGLWGFPALQTVVIGKDAQNIGGEYMGCDSLEAFSVSADNPYFKSVDGIIFSKDEKTLIKYPNNAAAAHYTVPDGVEIIDYSAFAYAQNLTEVTFCDSLTTIGHSAFEKCQKLQRADIPAGLTSIGKYAFYDCGALTAATMAAGYTQVPSNLFCGCQSLQTVVLPDSIQTISNAAFGGCASLAQINWPSSLTKVEDYAFSGCKKLEAATLNAKVELGETVFSGCDSMKSFDVDENNPYYQAIDGSLFSKDGKTMIQYASGDPRTAYTVPDGVETLGKYAFSEVKTLQTLRFGADLTDIGIGMYNLQSVSAFEVDENNTEYRDIDGVLFSKDGTRLYKYPPLRAADSYTIADTVTRLGGNSFMNAVNLHTLTVGSGLQTADGYSFAHMPSLENIFVDPDNAALEDIDGVLFQKDPAYLVFYPNNKQQTTYIVPDGTVAVGNQVMGEELGLDNTYLETMILPASVKEGCSLPYLTSLKNVYIYSNDFAFDYAFFPHDAVIYAFPGSTVERFTQYRSFNYVPLGDMSGDTAIGMNDALVLYLASSGKAVLTEEQTAAADVNGDGVVNGKDTLQLYRIASGR